MVFDMRKLVEQVTYGSIDTFLNVELWAIITICIIVFYPLFNTMNILRNGNGNFDWN